MANNLLTINMITRLAVRLWKNTNAFMRNLDTQYDNQYANVGAKIGSQLRIRLPVDFTVRHGAAASFQDVSEQFTTLTMATQDGVDMSFPSIDLTLSVDDFAERYIAPAVNNLAGDIAVGVMSGAEGGGMPSLLNGRRDHHAVQSDVSDGERHSGHAVGASTQSPRRGQSVY